MAEQEYPTLNGIAPSWADIGTTFTVTDGALLEMADYKDISWSDTVEMGDQRGASGGRRMRRTVGQKSEEASATFYLSGFRKLCKALMAKAPRRGNQALISLVAFDINIQHTPPGEVEIFDVKIKGCRIAGRDYAATEGSDAQVITVALNPIEIVDNIDGEEVVLI